MSNILIMLIPYSISPPPLAGHVASCLGLIDTEHRKVLRIIQVHCQIIIRLLRRFTIYALLATSLFACQTLNHSANWPANLPEQEIFINGYLQKRQLESATETQLNYHLGWIKKFYLGTKLYPNGWIKASNKFLATIDDDTNKKIADMKLRTLGSKIANEWAQDNDVRLINSSHIAIWASAMRTAAERQQHLSFLGQVDKDVEELIEQTIDAQVITYERYFEEEYFDDF